MDSSSGVSSLFTALAQNFDGDIDTSTRARSLGSIDSSFVVVPPQVIIFPKSLDDFGKIFSFAKEYRIPISVRGCGTSTSGGSLTEGIQIDMTRYFSKVERVNIKNNTATISAGTPITNIVERLEKVGVFCPLLSRETYAGTLGGLVAENAFTCASITHGDTRLWVEGIRIVLDDGKEYTIEEGVPPTGRLLEIYTNLSNYLEHESGNIHASVNKMIDSTSGYNIWNRAVGQRQLIDLLVGSEGTLGIVTAITLRVVPLIKHSYTLSCGVNTIADIHHAKKIYRNFDVDSLSLFDTSMLALSSLDDQKKLPAHIKKNNTRYILSGLFIRKQDEVAHHMVKSCGNKLIPLSKEIFVETGTSWVEEEHLFVKKTLHRHLARVGDFACITTLDSIATKEDANEKLTDELSQLITSYGYTQIFGTQASLTHVSLLFFADTITRQGRQHLEGFLKEASHIIMMYKGSITGGNGDGLVRTPYMETSSDAHMRNVFLYIQRLFDPEQIFNSGKKTFVTTTAIEHYLHNKASN